MQMSAAHGTEQLLYLIKVHCPLSAQHVNEKGNCEGNALAFCGIDAVQVQVGQLQHLHVSLTSPGRCRIHSEQPP